MNKKLLFLITISLIFSSCIFAASSKDKASNWVGWLKKTGPTKPTFDPQQFPALDTKKFVRSPRASTPAKTTTAVEYPNDPESDDGEILSPEEAAKVIGRVREAAVKMPPAPKGLSDIAVSFHKDGFFVQENTVDTPDWATLAEEDDSSDEAGCTTAMAGNRPVVPITMRELEAATRRYSAFDSEDEFTANEEGIAYINTDAALDPQPPVAGSIEDITGQIITLTKEITSLESPKEFEAIGDQEAQEKMLEQKRNALKTVRKKRGKKLLDRRTSYKQAAALKTTPKPAGVIAKIEVDKTQQHTPSATVPIFDMNEKPRILDGAKAPLTLLAVIQAPDALDIAEKDATSVKVTTPVAPDAEVVAEKEADTGTTELAIVEASAPAPIKTEDVKKAVPVAPEAQHPAFAGTLSADFKSELAKLCPTILTLHTETSEEGYASFHDREVRPQAEEEEACRTLPYSAKSTLPQALMRKQLPKETDKTLTLAQLLALKGINIDESEAQKYFADNRESILGHDVGSLPEVIIPEKSDRIELDAYYKALQEERDRTRSIKDDLYEKAKRLRGTAQEVQQGKADTFNAKRQTLLDTIHKHETDHRLPNTKSWLSTLAALNPWG